MEKTAPGELTVTILVRVRPGLTPSLKRRVVVLAAGARELERAVDCGGENAMLIFVKAFAGHDVDADAGRT